jgi:hypothetical protein
MLPIVLLCAVFWGVGIKANGDLPDTPVSVAIAVQDPSSAPLKNELVIVQNLDDHERELVRALTDDRGGIPAIELRPGVYRAIATAPYGLWQTTVREFLVGDTPVKLQLSVEPKPTHGYGDVVSVGNAKISLHVVDAAGGPIAGASILVRDREATPYLERWYTTDASGNVEVESVADPAVVVVIHGKTLITRELSRKASVETIRL